MGARGEHGDIQDLHGPLALGWDGAWSHASPPPSPSAVACYHRRMTPLSPPSSEQPAPPLAGMTVIELASILAGPITGQFLAELGADVVKIENPATGGDPTRGWRLPSESEAAAVSAYFSCANWGKSSLALDVAQEAGREVVDRLVAQADIVLVSYKPGDDRKLRLDAERLHGINPRLIYAQISAYGTADARPGFDAIIQAESGFTYLNGTPDGPPVKMPVALVDLLAAHQLKEAILLALLQRERTGSGAVVHVSLLAAAIASLANQATNYLVAGLIPRRMGSEHPNIVPYGSIFRTCDERALVLAVGTERQWRGLAVALGRPALADDGRFASNQQRVQHRDALNAELAAAFAALPSAEVAQRLGAAGVPFGFVNDMASVFALPESEPLMLEASGLRGVRSFIADGIGAAPGLRAPPGFNADGRTILEQRLGYDAAALAELQATGAWPG
jgi:crotonobetainyl-CoA:carnitine CoA-transferase CaiB-like acyl-CoA transferase